MSELAAVGYIKLPFLIVATVFAAVAAQLAALSVSRYAPYPAAGERPGATLPRRMVRRVVLLSQRWSEAQAARQAHND